MAHLILGEHPDGLTVRLVHGDGMTLAATLTDAAGAEIDWPATPSLEFAGPEHDAITTHAATIDGPTASWQLTRAQVDNIWTGSLTRYGNATTYVRALLPDSDDGSVEYAGRVAWSDGWTAGTQVQVKTFTRPVPVSTPGGGSDSLTVVNGGTVTLDDTKAEGSLVGYRVKATATFDGEGGTANIEPGAYTFERTDTGWIYYVAAGTTLGVTITPPSDWTTLATDDFTAANGTPIKNRTTSTGGLTWVDFLNNDPDVTIQGNRASFTGSGYGNRFRLMLGGAHGAGVRLSLDYQLFATNPNVGSIDVRASGEWTPHSAGVILDQNGGLGLSGSVPPTGLTGTTTGLPTMGRLEVEWSTNAVIVRVNGTQVATATLASPLLGDAVDVLFNSNAVAIDNLLIEVHA